MDLTKAGTLQLQGAILGAPAVDGTEVIEVSKEAKQQQQPDAAHRRRELVHGHRWNLVVITEVREQGEARNSELEAGEVRPVGTIEAMLRSLDVETRRRESNTEGGIALHTCENRVPQENQNRDLPPRDERNWDEVGAEGHQTHNDAVNNGGDEELSEDGGAQTLAINGAFPSGSRPRRKVRVKK